MTDFLATRFPHGFWHMGGFALYVWPAYGVVFIVMALNIVAAYWPQDKEK